MVDCCNLMKYIQFFKILNMCSFLCYMCRLPYHPTLKQASDCSARFAWQGFCAWLIISHQNSFLLSQLHSSLWSLLLVIMMQMWRAGSVCWEHCQVWNRWWNACWNRQGLSAYLTDPERNQQQLGCNLHAFTYSWSQDHTILIIQE